MKKTRRWLAMLLAVVLVSSNVIYQLGTNMSASESDSTTEAQQQDDSAEEKAQQDAASNAHKKDLGEAKVQEVNTEEDKNTSDTSKKTQVAEKTEKKQEQTAKKANAAKKADTSSGDTKKDSEEKAYKATIQKSKLDGGDIKAWGSDGKKETVAYTDSKYMKEVKEGDSFNFEITVKNSFKLDKVTDQNNNTIQPKKVDGNVYTYKIADVKSDKTFHVLYKEETSSKKNDSDNAKSDNKKDDADASDDGESDSKANEDKNVSAASENGKIATVADTDTEKTIHVGNSVTLDTKLESMWPTTYTHKWSVNPTGIVSLDSYNSSKVVVTGVKVGDVTVTDNYTKSTWAGESKGSKSYTVHVRSAVSPTGISITGADKVTQFKTTQLKANLTPADASGNVTWTSSNEQILSVNDNGLVTAKRQGTATVTASVQGTAKATLSATKTIEVVKDENPSQKREALVYYLKDPTKDANSNASDQWGPSSIGTAVVNVEGATWTGDKNCFDNVDQRVVSWPTNLSGNVIPRSNNAWDLIFNAYKASIESQLGVTIAEDDVEEISLAPAKISKGNGTTPDMHLDCNVNIKCKKVALIKYYLFDANGTNWEMLGSKNYLVKESSTTKPSDVTSKNFPTTKTVNGVTYTFSGWYTDQSLTTPAPSFPAQVTGAANYYAKYVAGYQVMYKLAGGKFRDGSTNATEKHNVDTDVVVKEQPTRAGYKFKGWTVEGLSGTTTIKSGETFTMPNGNVTLTAQWEEKDIKDYVTLNTQDVTKPYDGQSHAAGEATAVAKTGKENEVGTLTVEYQKANGDWTTNREEITAKDVSDSKTVNVRVTSTDLVGELTGTEKLTITKRAVTLTSASGEKVYDGQPLTNKNVTASTGENEGFVEGEGAAYKVTGTITNVGEKENTFTYTLNGNTKEENYNITSKTGKLKVTPVTTEVKVKITGHQNAVTYDGTEHTVTGYDVTEISNELYTANDFTFSGKAEATGTDADTYPMELKTSQFENKNANFTNVTFEVVDGSLTINPRNVTLTSATDSKVYDKKPLTNDTITVGGDGFVGDEGATYDVTGSQTDVGTSDNTFDYTLNKGTKSGNYNISKAEGKLTVTADENEIVVNIVGNTKTVKYNGKEQSVTDYTIESIQSNGKAYSKYTADDFTFSGTAEAKGKDAGSYNMGLKASDFTNTNKNFTKVTFVVTDGKLTIEKRKVTLTSADASKEYDGTPLTSNEVTVGGEDGFVEGEGVTYTVTGAQTEVGSSDNSFTYIANDKTNLEKNYEITKTEGTLTVKKNDTLEVTVNITGHTDSKMYNGKEQSVTDYDVTTSNGLYTTNDFEFKGTAKAAGTDAGDYAMGLKASDFTNTSKNFSKVKFVVKDGNLTITKRDVTLKTADAEKVYDGTALTKDGVTVGGDGFVDDEGATYNVTGTITNVGEKPNAFTYKLKDNTKAKNYNITETPGTLKVTPVTDKVTVTIKENDKNAKYDGNEHTDSGYTVKSISNNLYSKDDFTFSGTAEVKGTDAGTYDMNVKATDFTNTSGNFTNVEFVVEDGQLIISKRDVTLTSGSDEKVYDGTPLTKDKVTVSGDGFVKDEGAEYNVTGSQTKAGSSDNEFTYTLKDNTKKDNYNITVVKGTLTVTQDKNEVVVTITGHTNSAKYDGKDHTAKGYDVSINNKKYHASDFTFKGTDNVTKKDAGTYPMGLKESDFVNNSTDFEKVTFVVTDGSLTIEKRTVTLGSATASKVYDGTALTSKNITVGGDGFAEDEGATYDVTGSQTAVGSSNNTFTYELNKNTKAGNYTITTSVGTLTVTPQSITPDPDPENPDSYKGITINDPSDHIYDGEAHKWAPEVKDKDGNVLKEGTDYEVSYDKDNFTDVSTIKVTIKGKGNYTGTVTKEYKITPRPVTLTSADAKKVYDGKALTKEEVTASRGENEGFVGNDGADYNVTGTQTVVGTSKNTFGYTLKSGTLAKNYAITKVEGTLEVTPVTDKVTVTIQENSGKFTYDGTEKTVKGYEVESISNKLYSENDFSFSGRDTVKGTDAGTYDMELTAKDFANNNANFSNVEFIIKDGTLKIDKKDVTLTSASATKMYDGKALTKDEVTAEGFVGNDGATYNVTGSQTEVGTSDNTFTYELKKGTNPDNYNITKKNGELEVTPSDQKVVVTIKENSGKETYDGTEKTVTGYTVENISSKLPYTEKDFKFNGDATVKGTNAGTYNMELKPGDFKNINKNFSNVSFEIIDGTLTIDKRDVTLTSASDSKAYDGTALENKNVTAEGFVGNDGATYNVTGSQTEVGSSDNTFTYELNKGTNKDNYNIKTVNGKLTVTENADEVVVTITEKSGTVKYDGKEHTVEGYDVTNISNKLYTEKDFTFSGDATVKGTNAGTYNMEVKAGDFKNTNKNFSKVKFVIVDGTLTIEKRTVIMTSASQNKVYDGKALTNKDVTETGDGFVKGEGASYDVTGSQTNVGKSDNEFTYKLNKDTSKDNYTIKTNKGTLEVTPVTTAVKVTIKENGGTFKYDGEKKTVTGYTVKAITNPLYTEDDFTFGGTASVERTNAGTYDMEVKAADFKNISKNFTNVTFEVEDDQLVIEKRKVTLTSATDKKVYDGTALKNNEVTVTGDGFAANEGAAYDVTGSQTNVGESDNAFTYVLNKGTDAKNYEITKTEGKLTVTPVTDKVTVVVKENSDTVKYDGTTKSVIGYTVKSISNPLYQTKDFTFSGDASVNGTDAGTYDMEVKASDFANISKNFTNVEFKVEDGTLTIEKRKVTLTSASDEKVYDGKALKNAQVDVGGDGFATGEGASYDVTGSQTNVGSSDNTFTYELNSGTNSKNYTITTKEGTLKVTPVTDSVVVKVKENSGTFKYDGTKKTVEGYTVTSISNPLYTEKDFEFNGTAKVSGTNVGEYDMEVKASDFANISKNFTNVTFEVEDGKLIIEKRNVTLTSANDSKAYDGKALKNDTVTVSEDGFVKDEGASYDVTGSQTEVGESDNTFTYKLNKGTDENNYNIKKVEGKLVVTASEDEVVVTITENSGTFKYDGTEKSVSGYQVTDISNKLYTANDFKFSGNASVKGTRAGTYDMEVKASDFKNTNKNFNKVTFVIVDGTLTIEKRNVTLTSASASKEYDGTALTSKDVTVTGDGFAAGEGAAYDVTGSQTNVGKSDNEFTYKLDKGTDADNYVIKTEKGTLEVTPVTSEVVVKIKENSGTEKYDGTEKSVNGYKVTSISNKLYTEKDFEFSGDASVKGTDAGTYDMNVKAADFKNISKNFGKVKFEVEDGQLVIEKRKVTLTSASDEKVYDGTALKNNEVTVSGDGFAEGEDAAYDVTGSRTNVGESDNTFTYKLNKGTKADNYEITTKEGTLKVTPVTDKVTVKIKGNNDKSKYDGSKKTVEGYKVVDISNKLYTEKDFEFSGTDKVSGTNAGSYDMGMTAGDFANISKNFANVVFEVEDGQLVIEKRKVTMTSDSGSKAYDGEALTKKHVTESEDGFVKGEGAAYDVTGSQLYVGESDNEFTYELNKGTKADNYDITVVKGKLTVTASKEEVVVTITENSGTYKYDGTEKSVTGYKVTSISNKLYSKDDFEFSGNDKVSGTDAGSYDMNLKASDFKNTNKNFDNVKFVIVDGTLTIEKRKVTMTSEDAGKTYDGTALTNKTVNESGDGFAEGEGATYDVTGTQTNAGSSDNTFTYKLNKGTKADNYIIETKEGKLTVTPVTAEVTVNIKEHSGKKLYNGSEQSVSGYDVTNISNALYKVKDFEFSGNDTVSGTNAGNYDMNITPADFKNISKNFTNVKFVIEDGKLVIEKRNVTLTSASDKKVYDGKALTNDTVQVSGDGFVLGEGATYSVTGSQLDAGESDNAFTYKLFDNTSADNYIIKTEKGKLKVTPITDEVVVTVKGNSKDATYDGDEKTAEGYKVTDISNSLYTDNDFTFTGDASVKATDAGQYWMDVKSSDFTNISKNFTNVRFVFENGVLTIGKRNVILTSASDSKAYDGKPLTNDEVTVDGDGFAKGEGAAYDVTGSQLNVGTSDNTFTYELNANTKADNYNIELVEGKLTVTADENEVVVTITENRGTEKYNGRVHSVSGYEVTDISNKLYTAEDFKFSGDATVKGTDAGTYDMNVKAADFENVNDNFAKVTFVIIDGKLTIEKRDVTLTSADASKVYDGTALTSKKVTVSGEGFAKGEGATYDVTGTRTNTGTSKNTFTYTLKNGTKAANYNIKKVEGKLTITAASVTPTPPTPQNRNVVQRVVTAVRNVPSRIARAVQETGAKVRELVNAGDDNVPLGNQKLDDHKCCVLHFLIMLLTAILYGFFTHNLKKRQKKLFEVREELDTELAKRGLPTTKEQKQQ